MLLKLLEVSEPRLHHICSACPLPELECGVLEQRLEPKASLGKAEHMQPVEVMDTCLPEAS